MGSKEPDRSKFARKLEDLIQSSCRAGIIDSGGVEIELKRSLGRIHTIYGSPEGKAAWDKAIQEQVDAP